VYLGVSFLGAPVQRLGQRFAFGLVYIENANDTKTIRISIYLAFFSRFFVCLGVIGSKAARRKDGDPVLAFPDLSF
jgi:hypothetical protein